MGGQIYKQATYTKLTRLGEVEQVCNPSIWGRKILSSRSKWTAEQVQGKHGLQGKILCLKEKKKTKTFFFQKKFQIWWSSGVESPVRKLSLRLKRWKRTRHTYHHMNSKKLKARQEWILSISFSSNLPRDASCYYKTLEYTLQVINEP